LPDQPDPTKATIGPTRARYLGVVFVLGALLGYTIVSVSEHLNATAPTIQWAAVVVLAAIAAMLAVLAYTTYRTVHRERRLIEPHRALNYLMLAKACALMGALVAGGYLGFGASFLDQLDIMLPRERVIRSFSAAFAALVVMVCGLLLERACRIPRDPDE
jgi:4-hydroxybenzoate polyprenyltransferase